MASGVGRDIALSVVVDDAALVMPPKVFKTGSKGWFYSGKLTIAGLRVQCTFSAVIVGSKAIVADQTELVEFINDKDEVVPELPKKAAKPKKARQAPVAGQSVPNAKPGA